MSVRTALLASVLLFGPVLPAAASVIAVAPSETPVAAAIALDWSGRSLDVAIEDGAGRATGLDPVRGGAGIHAFEIGWSAATGSLTLAFDLDGDGGFGKDEIITRSSFDRTEGLYAGQSFALISITGRDGRSGRSALGDLVVNGVAQDAIEPGMAGATLFLAPEKAASFGDLRLTGRMTLANDGRRDPRADWIVAFRGPVESKGAAQATNVPEPRALALMGVGLLGLAAVRRQR